MSENVILYGDIRLPEYEDMIIQQISIEQELNNHSRLTVTGIIKEENLDDYTSTLFLDQHIHVKRKEELIFSGIITNAKIKCIQDINYLDITVLSHTYRMDIEPRCRSFQDAAMKYAEVIGEITSQYPRAGFLDKITQGKEIGRPIIQYKETDWEFLMRLASHFHTSIVPNSRGEGARFFFGLPEIDQGELTAHNYSYEKDFHNYKKVHVDSSDLKESDFTFIEVETEKIYELGDQVMFKSKPMYVIRTSLKYKQAVIKNTCRLACKKGATVKYMPHTNIAGCSIFGKIIAVARDNVKIHLEIDEIQSIDQAYWYPFASMYASENETGWYCMPEIGDVVRLYHPDDSEDKAMSVSSVKPHNPDENVEKSDPQNRMSNPDVKYLRTAFGKEIKFRPDGIDIIAKDGTVFMTLNDDGSVNLNSSDKISFTAVNDIEIKARDVNIEATEHIKYYYSQPCKNQQFCEQ